MGERTSYIVSDPALWLSADRRLLDSGKATPGAARQEQGVSTARNKGGHIRKNNKPTTQPYDQKRLATI